jgi:hypothetical protein
MVTIAVMSQPATLLSDLTAQLEQLASRRDELTELLQDLRRNWPASAPALAPIHILSEVLPVTPTAVTTRHTARRTKRDYDYFSDLDLALQKLRLDGGGGS